MKTLPIRMLTSICGPDIDLQAGQETDRFSVKEAVRLIESQQAVPVSQAAYEQAVRKPAESRAGVPGARRARSPEARSLGRMIADAATALVRGK